MHYLSGQSRRDALRAALKASAEWPYYRATLGKNAAELTMSELQDAFNALHPRTSLEDWAAAANLGTDYGSETDSTMRTESTAKPESVPVKSDSVDADTLALAKIIAGLKGKAEIDESAVRAIVEDATNHLAARIDDAVSMIADLAVPTRITVVQGDVPVIEGATVHSEFPRLLKVASSRMSNGIAPNIWIAGPTGSGKTTACEMAAKALGLAFYFNGALSMPHELLGFVDAAGTYHTTPFREAFEHGGCYLFDECDGSDNAALLALNAALANGMASFPDSSTPVRRHKDFICFAAGNTWGGGATAEFIGRAKLDAAFLSRFPVKLAWDYDSTLEIALSGNAEWARYVQRARAIARNKGVKVVIDPRHTMAGAGLIANGFTFAEVADMTFLAGMTPDQKAMFA